MNGPHCDAALGLRAAAAFRQGSLRAKITNSRGKPIYYSLMRPNQVTQPEYQPKYCVPMLLTEVPVYLKVLVRARLSRSNYRVRGVPQTPVNTCEERACGCVSGLLYT